jgi:hypothetical protein
MENGIGKMDDGNLALHIFRFISCIKMENGIGKMDDGNLALHLPLSISHLT